MMEKLFFFNEGFIKVDIDKIVVPENLSVRMHSAEEYEELKKSIEKKGIVVPLVVVKDEVEKKYYLADGRNRLKAARELNLKEVPVIVYASVLGKAEAIRMAIELEIARRHLTKPEWLTLKDQLKNLEKEFIAKEDEVKRRVFSDFLRTGKEKISEIFEKKLAELEREKEKLEKEKKELQTKIELLEEKLDELTSQLKTDELIEESIPFDIDEVSENLVIPEEKIKEIEERAQREVYQKLRSVEAELIELKDELRRKKNELAVLRNEIKFVERNRDYIRNIAKCVCEPKVVVEHISMIKTHLVAIDRIFSGLAELGKLFYKEEWEKIQVSWNEMLNFLKSVDKQLKDFSRFASIEEKADVEYLREKSDQTDQPLEVEKNSEELEKDAEELGVSVNLLKEWGGEKVDFSSAGGKQKKKTSSRI